MSHILCSSGVIEANRERFMGHPLVKIYIFFIEKKNYFQTESAPSHIHRDDEHHIRLRVTQVRNAQNAAFNFEWKVLSLLLKIKWRVFLKITPIVRREHKVIKIKNWM